MIEECLQIALQAPTGGNRQRWHFVVVTDAGKRRALAELYRQAWAVYLTLPTPPPTCTSRIRRERRYSAAWVTPRSISPTTSSGCRCSYPVLPRPGRRPARPRSGRRLGLDPARGVELHARGPRARARVGVDHAFHPILFVPVFAGNLKPQHGGIGEVGGSVDLGTVQGRASLYRMQLKDEIGYDGALGANVNFDPRRRQGLEAELDWRITGRLRTRLAYAYTDAEFRSGPYDGRRVPLVPRDKATLQLTWDAGQAGSYAAVANYVGARRYSGDFSNVRGTLAGYTTLDFQAAWKLKPWTVTGVEWDLRWDRGHSFARMENSSEHGKHEN